MEAQDLRISRAQSRARAAWLLARLCAVICGLGFASIFLTAGMGNPIPLFALVLFGPLSLISLVLAMLAIAARAPNRAVAMHSLVLNGGCWCLAALGFLLISID
jgi:hypothetical protein